MSADLTSLLAEHRFMARNAAGRMGCRGCPWSGTKSPGTDTAWAEYAVHLAAVIEDSDWLAARDRQTAARAVEAAADEAEAIDGAAFTASFPAGSGLSESERQECIDSADALLEAPWDWLRDRARAIREGADHA